MAGENEKEETCPYDKERVALFKSHSELLKAAFRYHKSPLLVSAMLHVLHSSMMDLEFSFLGEMTKCAKKVVENVNAEKRDA